MNRSIAFFDFDGTVTTKDTLLEFIRFSKGNLAFVAGFLLYSPWIVAFKAGIISNQAAKERVLTHFFKGWTAEAFNTACLRFAEQRLPSLLRPQALTEIDRLKRDGAEVVIVSASPEDWIRPWTEAMDIKLIASRLILSAGRLTGRIHGANCHGEEKVRRIGEKYQLKDFTDIFAFGDSSGDKPMLALANHPYYKPFR